jgi:hypothetical protein
MRTVLLVAYWSAAIGGAWLGAKIAPPGSEFGFGFIGLVTGAILVMIWEIKNKGEGL